VICLSCRLILGFFACIHCVSSLLIRDTFYVVVFYYIFICVSCFDLVVSTCQVIGWKDSFDVYVVRRLPSQNPGRRNCLCVFSLLFGLFRNISKPQTIISKPSNTEHLVCLCFYVFSPALYNISHVCGTIQPSLFVLKVLLNTNKTKPAKNCLDKWSVVNNVPQVAGQLFGCS